MDNTGYNAPSTTSSSISPSSLLTYAGSTGQIYKIWFKNLLFMIITFGIYRAWAKVRIRKYLWAHTSIDGDAFHYTGTGGELFRGYMKVALLYFVVSLAQASIVMTMDGDDMLAAEQQRQQAIYEAMKKCGYTSENRDKVTNEIYYDCLDKHGIGEETPNDSITTTITNLLVLLFFFYIISFARYSSLRYRLSRTTWRGVHGRMTGNANKYAFFAFGRAFLNLISLGILIPKSDMAKQAYIMRDMYLGNQQASFMNDTSGLMKIHIITWLLAIPTFTLSRLWYIAALKNKKLANTSFGGLTCQGNYTGGKLAGLYIINILLIIMTLGFATPVVINRTVRFHVANTIIEGNIESTMILQTQSDAGNIGEGLADSFDSGLDIDFGFI